MFKKKEYSILKDRLAEPRRFIQVISGPRQVGKSTMVKQVLNDTDIPHIFVTADGVSPQNQQWINEVWETARARKNFANLPEFLLVIDEVHKVNNWSEAIKKEWDWDTFHDINIKVVLLGSSRLLLKDGLTESLAGRFELIRMSHWTYEEMHEAFDLDLNQYIYFGGYPGSAQYIKDEKRWRSYIKDSIIAPAITQDILMTKTIYKPSLMQQLFFLGCTYSGEEMSLNKILGQLQDAGNVTTLANYLNILDETRLLKGMQKYAHDNARKYNSVPKLMVYNTALLSALSNTKYEQVYTAPKTWGRWVESAVGSYLLAKADELDYKVYYWRDRDEEVDFIIDYYGKLTAIEVKSGRRTTNTGLQVFKDSFNPEHALVVGSDAFPLEEFLRIDLEKLLGKW
nr:ATP-binding protein [uncultured Prevotella sp.]